MKQLRIRKVLGSFGAVVATMVLLAPAALAVPAGSGSSSQEAVRSATVQSTSGTSEFALVALGAAITVVIVAAIRLSFKGIERRRTAHA